MRSCRVTFIQIECTGCKTHQPATDVRTESYYSNPYDEFCEASTRIKIICGACGHENEIDDPADLGYRLNSVPKECDSHACDNCDGIPESFQ